MDGSGAACETGTTTPLGRILALSQRPASRQSEKLVFTRIFDASKFRVHHLDERKTLPSICACLHDRMAASADAKEKVTSRATQHSPLNECFVLAAFAAAIAPGFAFADLATAMCLR